MSTSEIARTPERWMQRWLTLAGFAQIQQRICMVDISSGAPLHALFEVRLGQTLMRLASWLRQRDLLKGGAWERRVFTVWQEVQSRQFAASLPIVFQYPQVVFQYPQAGRESTIPPAASNEGGILFKPEEVK